MSAPHSGFDTRHRDAMHAKNVHGRATYQLEARGQPTRETRTIAQIVETPQVQAARAEKLVAEKAEEVPLDFLLAQLEEMQIRRDEANDEKNTDGINLANAEIALLQTRIGKQREAQKRIEIAKRDNRIATETAQLKPVEEYEDLSKAFSDAWQRYGDLQKEVQSDATLATQHASRALHDRITSLLPATAKHEIARNLKNMSKEKYAAILQQRIDEITTLDESDALEDGDRRLIERDLHRETLRQLAQWGEHETSLSAVEQKKRQRVLKATVTRLENQKKKIEEKLAIAWDRPMEALGKLLPWKRWAWQKELTALARKAEIERGRLQAIVAVADVPRARAEVRMNVPYFEEDGERAEEMLYDNGYEKADAPEQRRAA